MNSRLLSKPARRWLWLLAGLLVVLSLAALVVPLFILRPFSAQTPESVGIAYAILHAAPWGCAAAALAVLFLEARLWRGAGWSRVGLVVLGVLAVGVAGLVRVNLFEKIFAPISDPVFARVSEASWVAPHDLVLALDEPPGQGGHCFPVRQIAYHHVVNLEVDGRPLVATY